MPDSSRALLRVYLGYAPGGGKTTRLLEDARALRERGVDVLVAWANARGRQPVVAGLDGLEVLPVRRFEFRGLSVAELDLEAALARRPQVVVVDDLAHSNVPGLRHRRRHQDVQALLAAGISVLTALDVQHVEGLNDVVARVAGVEERETVPDALFDRADELLALDLPVSDHLRRVESGATSLARSALGRPETLQALRELMLREAAEHAHGRGSPPPSASGPGAGRVLVALSSLSPRAATLLRRGSRFAGRLNTAWFVVYVETPGEAPERIGPEAERTLLRNVDLARELGAEVVRLKARDAVPALIDFGRAHGVAHLLIGRSGRRHGRTLLKRPPGGSWLDLVRGPFHERLLRQALDFDVYVVAQEEPQA